MIRNLYLYLRLKKNNFVYIETYHDRAYYGTVTGKDLLTVTIRRVNEYGIENNVTLFLSDIAWFVDTLNDKEAIGQLYAMMDSMYQKPSDPLDDEDEGDLV